MILELILIWEVKNTDIKYKIQNYFNKSFAILEINKSCLIFL